MQLSFFLSILLLSKCIYALDKQYLNSQTISGIKYCCLRGVPGKRHKDHHYKSGTAFSLQKRLQMIKSAILTPTEIPTILSPIREAEGPENVRKWSL